ncbi:MAG: hypothetical protein ABSA39_03775 [Edaphobacter sp.]
MTDDELQKRFEAIEKELTKLKTRHPGGSFSGDSEFFDLPTRQENAERKLEAVIQCIESIHPGFGPKVEQKYKVLQSAADANTEGQISQAVFSDDFDQTAS